MLGISAPTIQKSTFLPVLKLMLQTSGPRGWGVWNIVSVVCMKNTKKIPQFQAYDVFVTGWAQTCVKKGHRFIQ